MRSIFFHSVRKRDRTPGPWCCESDQGDAGFAFERVGIADKSCGVRKSVKDSPHRCFPRRRASVLEDFRARNIFRRVAIFQHGHVTAFIEHKTDEVAGFFFVEGGLDAATSSMNARSGANARPAVVAVTKSSMEVGQERGRSLRAASANARHWFFRSARRDVEHARMCDVVIGCMARRT